MVNDSQIRIKAEQDKFDAIFYGSETPMVLFKGPSFCLEMFNKKYEEIYLARDLILGKPFFDIIPELRNSQFPNILKNVYDSGVACTIKEGQASIYNVEKGHNEDRFFHTTFSRINFGNDSEHRILATPREVTDRVLARKEIENNLIEIQEERELREKFVSALSHDLRTPLAVAKMCTQFLAMKSNDPNDSKDSKDSKEMIERISSSLDRADRMIRDLLDANRMKAGGEIYISRKVCQLDSIVRFIVKDLKEIYGDKFHLSIETSIEGYWDEMAIHRIVENLLINAVKFGSPDKKVTITLDIVKDCAELAIHNYGSSISPEHQEFIFDQYNRPRINSQQIGWGIGLSIAKGLVEAHAGEISVESCTIAGTTFKIRLPINDKQYKGILKPF
jgi:signal transduction histidine kinase